MNELVERFVSDAVAQRRADITELAREIGQLPQIVRPPQNVFCHGIYARGIHLQAGDMVVGKIHRHEHLSFGWGDISVFSPQEGLQRFTGHWWTTAKPGIQRAVYCHADTFWCAVHPNPDDETDLAELERRYIAREFAEVDAAELERMLREAL